MQEMRSIAGKQPQAAMKGMIDASMKHYESKLKMTSEQKAKLKALLIEQNEMHNQYNEAINKIFTPEELQKLYSR